MAMHLGQRPETNPELIAAFDGLATVTIGNVRDDLGLGGMGLNLRPVAVGMPFVEVALTLNEVTGAQHDDQPEAFALGAVMDMARPLDVVVIDNGVRGLVVDGGVRNADEIIALKSLVMSRHIAPLSGQTRVKVNGAQHLRESMASTCRPAPSSRATPRVWWWCLWHTLGDLRTEPVNWQRKTVRLPTKSAKACASPKRSKSSRSRDLARLDEKTLAAVSCF